MANAKQLLQKDIKYACSLEEAIIDSDAVFIVTEWHEITDDLLEKASRLMKEPVIFDGRNCFSLEEARQFSLEYHSIGRPAVYPEK